MIFAVLLSSCLLVGAQNVEINNRYFDNVDLPLAFTEQCDAITDCFTCTLSNCLWRGASCEVTQSRGPLSVQDFFSRGRVCGDPLYMCNKREGMSQDGYRQTSYQFDKSQWDTTIYKGYFCIVENFGKEGDLNSFVVPNATGSESILFNMNYTTKQKNSPTKYWEDYMNNIQVYLEAETFINEFIVSTIDFQFAYINLETRRLGDTSDFQINVKQVDFSYTLAQMQEHQPVIFVLFVGFVVLWFCCCCGCFFFFFF